ncbi:hypothetical protein EMA8858_04079 [Emticicia aquatica]|uniref:Uncharacterized protein n=1 Tax=Emticicia aquatica TaxID=1681835 RepID=A0ABN8F265_9BACT|nr:hypothetical protein EMA8858_04079 [Emticicia aquatica]
MFFQLQIFLIASLLTLGIYEVLQLTKLGKTMMDFINLNAKKLQNLMQIKKYRKNIFNYKY